MINKRSLLVTIYVIYIAFILISTIPYIAEQEAANRGTITNGEYRSNLMFPDNGVYGHYRYVTLFDNSTPGYIDLKYIYETNTLYIERLENVRELKIDCRLMYAAKSQEVFDEDPLSMGLEYYKTYFTETNDGLFTVIINTDSPMDTLQFLRVPMPKRVLVNNKDWWDTETSYYSVDGEDVTITNVPKGTTTVDIYFQEVSVILPVAQFVVSKNIVIEGEEFYLDAGSSYDEDGQIEHYVWDFDDGTQGSGSLLKHSYSTIGNYTITLTVRDDDFLEGEASKIIYVIREDADSDGDNVPNVLDPNPFSALDSDNDGLADDYETEISHTNIYERDSDSDGWDDQTEIESGTDPINPYDHPPEKKDDGEETDLTGVFVAIVIVIIVVIILVVIIFVMIFIKKRKGEGKDQDKDDDGKKGQAGFFKSFNLKLSKKSEVDDEVETKGKGKDVIDDEEMSDEEKFELEELEREAKFLMPSDSKILIERFKKK